MRSFDVLSEAAIVVNGSRSRSRKDHSFSKEQKRRSRLKYRAREKNALSNTRLGIPPLSTESIVAVNIYTNSLDDLYCDYCFTKRCYT